MNEAATMTRPQERTKFLALPGFEVRLASLLNSGALVNGWLITGGEGNGKATLAFRLARALLWRERPVDNNDLHVPEDSRAFALVASGGHPDLFVAARKYDEKKERYATEISVETIRDLTMFLNHTASMGGWRVAIVDTADDLNRNSANALLKALEEPPARTAIFLLSATPGRLLATIRSRCRRIDLRPLDNETIRAFLIEEGAAKGEAATKIAREAGGRPGYALSLALSDGAEAIELADDFWRRLNAGEGALDIASKLVGKNADAVWPTFQSIFIDRVTAEARRLANANDKLAAEFARMRERSSSLFARGNALNLDRAQVLYAVEREFKSLTAVSQ